MNIAQNLMDDAQAGLQPLSLDSIRRAAPESHKFTVAGTVGASSRTDQTAFYNLLTDVAESATHDLVSPTITSSGWTAATATRYVADNPAPLKNIHFTAASIDSLLENSALRFVRKVPSGANQDELIQLSTFVSQDRYQPKILTVPINGEVLDGYTYVRVLSPEATPTANSYTVTFSFGATVDRRAEVPPARPAAVR